MKQLVMFALCSIFAFAQEPTETLGGIVTEPRGLVEGAPVQIRHVETGAVFRVMSAPDGSFRFTALPSGAYDVSVRFPGFSYSPFFGKTTVLTGKPAVLEVRLEIDNLGTLGDDPATYLAGERKKLNAADSRTSRVSAALLRSSDLRWLGFRR